MRDSALSDAASDTNRWCVYVLANPAGRTYVGVTTDVARRLRQHNGELAGGARFTRGRGPWRLVHLEDRLAGRAAAQSREYHLKRDRALRRRLLQDAMAHFAVGCEQASEQEPDMPHDHPDFPPRNRMPEELPLLRIEVVHADGVAATDPERLHRLADPRPQR